MAGASKFRWLLGFVGGFIKTRSSYKDIRSNPESRKVSTLMGKKSIGYTVIFLVLLGLAVALGYWGIGMVKAVGFLLGIIMVVASIGLAFYSLSCLILALITAIMQLSLNRRAIGWIALILVLIVVAVAVVGFLLLTSL